MLLRMSSDPRYVYPPGATFRERAAVRAAYHRAKLTAPHQPAKVADVAPAATTTPVMPQGGFTITLPAPSPRSSRFWRSYMRLLDLQIVLLWLQLIPLVLGSLLVLGVVGVVLWLVLFG